MLVEASVQALYADTDLLVVEKPAGLLAVPGRGDDKQDCLSARVQAQWPDALVVHRLDMATSGLLLFARNDVCAAVNRVEKGVQATGVAGVATNKGGVAIGIRIWDTEICFINSHLAAHQDRCVLCLQRI